MRDEPLVIQSPHAKGVIYATGGLFTRAEFRLPSGRWVRPLVEAPWSSNPPPGLPGHMKRLGGEFFCLPFGGGSAVKQVSPGWEELARGAVNEPMHGPAANADWQVVEQRVNEASLVLHCPSSSSIDRIERKIALSPEEPRLDSTVWVHARKPSQLPAGFHPILRLPDLPSTVEIDTDFAIGLTYPGVIEPDRMVCEPGRMFETLAAVPKRLGGTVDLRKLPLGPATEDVVMLAGVRGAVLAHFSDEHFALEINWSRALLPHCMVWIHDRGSDQEPWSGRFRGLGIEPVASAFDGPWEFSAGSNPLNEMGFATSVLLHPENPTQLHCSLLARERADLVSERA